MKIVKRGWRNLIYNPSSIIKRNIKLHFDMHHGYGLLEKASELLKEDDSCLLYTSDAADE